VKGVTVKTHVVLVFVLSALWLLILPASGLGDAVSTYHVPRLEGITIDGKPGDWGANGFRVELVPSPFGKLLDVHDFDIRFRVGWNEQGLLVLAHVQDDLSIESPELDRLWRRDCVEFFVADKVGSGNRWQLVVAPGADPSIESERHRIYDHREFKETPAELTASAACSVAEGGYVAEALLPWQNIGLEPRYGRQIAFQLVANDDDDDGGGFRVGWYPSIETHSNPKMMHAVLLSDKTSPAILHHTRREIGFAGCTIRVDAARGLIGEKAIITSEGELIARASLKPDAGRAAAEIQIDPVSEGEVFPEIHVTVAGESAGSYEALPALPHVIDKYVDALGGRDALEKLVTRYCWGTLVHDLHWRDPPLETVPVEIYTKTPKKWVLIKHTSEGVHRDGSDGTVGWRQGADSIERDDYLTRSKLGWLLNPQNALRIHEFYPGTKLMRKELFHGREVFVAEPASVDRAHGALYFDTKSGMLHQIGYYWTLHDYREVDGVKVPHRIRMSRKGGSSTYTFDEIVHNIPVDDVQFAMPYTAEIFADAFRGIDDPRVLPMLKHLPYEHGGMNIPCRDGRLLYDLIVTNGYKRGLEIGTSNGYSTLWLGLALRETEGQLVTIEIEPLPANEAQENFRKAGLDDVIDVRINDAFAEIPNLEGEFDFVFIDAWKPDYYRFLQLVKDRVVPGGAITAHNVIGQSHDMQDFLSAINSDPDLKTTIHTTSRSGVSISIKR
jgi:predicted O-methyltransferase YrrM